NPQVPPPLRWILGRCFAKDPEERYVSTKDMARDFVSVRNYLSDSASGAASIDVLPPPRRRAWIRAVIELVVVVAVGGTVWIVGRPTWKNPLADATFSRFTSWEGSELDASISSDGKLVAFLADRNGSFDVWEGQVGTGQFENFTKGREPTVANSFVHSVGFSGDGARVWFRVNTPDGKKHSLMFVPTFVGAPRGFSSNTVAAAWSPDHERIVYFTPEPGDPIFVADANGGNPRKICVDKPGIHQHYVTWSPDGRFIYFGRGLFDEMDIWRVPAAGGV